MKSVFDKLTGSLIRFVALFLFFTIPYTLSPGSCRSAENPLNVFNEANGFYEKGDYVKAIELYESLANNGGKSAELYYNLGNAYYRNRQPGKALVNYERASRVSPNDADIRYNLSFVRSTVQEPAESFFENIVSRMNDLVSTNGLTLLCSFLLLFLAAGLSVYLFRKTTPLLAVNAVLVLSLLFSGSWLALKIKHESARWAVVISGPCDVRNGPGTDNSVGFTLPEGRKVVVLGQKDDWAAIGLRTEGLKGWIEKKYIEEI